MGGTAGDEDGRGEGYVAGDPHCASLSLGPPVYLNKLPPFHEPTGMNLLSYRAGECWPCPGSWIPDRGQASGDLGRKMSLRGLCEGRQVLPSDHDEW